jgi:hypothetical protein
VLLFRQGEAAAPHLILKRNKQHENPDTVRGFFSAKTIKGSFLGRF